MTPVTVIRTATVAVLAAFAGELVGDYTLSRARGRRDVEAG